MATKDNPPQPVAPARNLEEQIRIDNLVRTGVYQFVRIEPGQLLPIYVRVTALATEPAELINEVFNTE